LSTDGIGDREHDRFYQGGMGTCDRQQEVALSKFSRPKYRNWKSLASDRPTRAAVRRSPSRLDWVLF
jgi:hypothetical protein